MNNHLCTCVALLIWASSLGCAQSDTQHALPNVHTAATPSASRDRGEGLIKLDVVVSDETGNPVPGLGEADFSLLENGRRQNILSFQAFDGRGTSSEPPVKVILLIDTMEMPEILAREERLAVMTSLRRGGGRLERPASVFLLADSGLWTFAPSSDGNVLAREIESNTFTLVRPNVGWQKSSAIVGSKEPPSKVALKALGQIATEERKRPGKKLLLWVGPGWGLGSGAYVNAAAGSPPPFDSVWWFSALLREAHVVLYSFTVGETDPHTLLYRDHLAGVTSPEKASFMNLYRKVLAVQSGGRVMEEGLDVVKQIESCVQDAGPYYRISFDPFPAGHPNEYHDLKIVVNRPGLIGRTNTGYYDQQYYSIDPIPQPRRVSLAQLEPLLAASGGKSDADLAKELSELALTERLSEDKLLLLNAAASGKRVRQELRILADSATFLDAPAKETPIGAPPDLNTQQHILSLTSAYLRTTIHKLPDLFARRTTVRYQETPVYSAAGSSVDYQPLHVTDSSTAIVLYRNGHEIPETKPPKRKPHDPELITYGIFGPALEGVLDTINGNGGLTWSRWEQGARGPLAVFRYTIPPETSLRPVWLCCLPDGDGTEAFQRYAGYHEEIAIDPGSGAILRLEFQADLKSTTPLAREDIMIEYGPVDIGGKTYVCPLRSVTIVRGRTVRILTDWDEAFMAYGPYATMVNDIRFDGYHIFRSESHMLPDFIPVER
ncbi:MAG TPA: VWA domain-containing protein [Terracidiphilus sp.]|nr:VWA domain-containing protein [Terracidiphilus sp.]